MKIVRVVLLLSALGATAACRGGSPTDPQSAPAAAKLPLTSSSPDSIGTRDGGHAIGSGT